MPSAAFVAVRPRVGEDRVTDGDQPSGGLDAESVGGPSDNSPARLLVERPRPNPPPHPDP